MLHLIYASNHVEINILFSLPGWNFSLEFATFWCGKASAINHPQKRGWVLGPIFGMICNSNLAGQLRSMVHWCSLLVLLHYIVSVNPKIRSFWNIQNSSNFHQTFIKHMEKKDKSTKILAGKYHGVSHEKCWFSHEKWWCSATFYAPDELPGVTNRRDRSLPPAAERLEAPPTAWGPRIELSDYL